MVVPDTSARERILVAAEELFAESGFDATPTSKIAERAGVPKGLVHYYFRRKQDLLVALVDRLPSESIDPAHIAVTGEVKASLKRLLVELARWQESSLLLRNLLWREADTHPAVRDALQLRFTRLVDLIRQVMQLACGQHVVKSDVDSAAELLALAVSYRHSVARHAEEGERRQMLMERELAFIADALALGAGASAAAAQGAAAG